MTSERCIFEGEFGEIHIPDLLTFLDMLGRTGTLELTRDDEKKCVYWDRGEIIYATSSAERQQVASYLSVNGWVAPDALEEARAEADAEDAVVKALIKAGALDPTFLPRAVRDLVLDIVYSAFEWNAGRFRFLLTDQPYPERVALKTSVSNIIMDGGRRMDEWQRIREAIPHDEVYPQRAAEEEAATVKLPELEQAILGLVDGQRTVAGIIREVEHDQFTVLGALMQLDNAGMIDFSEEPAIVAADDTLELEVPGLSEFERQQATRTLETFNNIFSGIHDRVVAVKGSQGTSRYAKTLLKPSFQKEGLFVGVEFEADGKLPIGPVLVNVAQADQDQRMSRLKGTLDRLLAQLVVQLDKSYDAKDKRAVSDLIAREKSRLAEA